MGLISGASNKIGKGARVLSQEIKETPQSKIYLVFIGLSLILIGMAIFFSPSVKALFDGWYYILTHPSIADFDGLSKPGHYGSAFLNSGLLLLCVMLIYGLTKTKITGLQIAAAMLIMGFAFYGKDIFNVWWPAIGVFIHAKMQKKPLSDVTAMAFFSASIAPIFSITAFGVAQVGTMAVDVSVGSVLLGACFGIASGMLISVIAPHLVNLHKGYVLFNVGFAAGIVGIFMYALRRATGIGHEQIPYVDIYDEAYVTGANLTLGIVLAIIFAYFIICGILLGGAKEYKQLFWYKGKGGNYVDKFGAAPSLINMGVLGFMVVAYVLIADIMVEGHLGGPLFAAIFTAVGFAANGVTTRTHLSLMCGVFISAFITGAITGAINGDPFLLAGMTKVGTRSMLLAAIFICGMCPVPGEHGFKAGIVAGIAHAVIVPYTGAFHGWMSLYNNGLALSLVATFLYPLYCKFGVKKDELPA